VHHKANYDAVSNKQEDWGIRFNEVLHNSTQDQVYGTLCERLVQDACDGHTGCVMTYGQTGSGKTFTIFGKKPLQNNNDAINDPDAGIVPRAVKQIFESIRKSEGKVAFLVRVSFMQVYMETITDLIRDEGDEVSEVVNPSMIFSSNSKRLNLNAKEGLQIREDPKTGIFVKGLKQIVKIRLTLIECK